MKLTPDPIFGNSVVQPAFVTCSGCAWLIDRDGNGHRPGSSCVPAVLCTKNHFDIENGAQCPRCGKMIERDGSGREINAPESVRPTLPPIPWTRKD